MHLSNNILLTIYRFLEPEEVALAAAVCQTWKIATDSGLMWLKKFEIETKGHENHMESYKKWCLKQLKAVKFESLGFFDRTGGFNLEEFKLVWELASPHVKKFELGHESTTN